MSKEEITEPCDCLGCKTCVKCDLMTYEEVYEWRDKWRLQEEGRALDQMSVEELARALCGALANQREYERMIFDFDRKQKEAADKILELSTRLEDVFARRDMAAESFKPKGEYGDE